MFSEIEILDTTLRDGEQTDGVSFNAFEKRQIARFLLEQLNVSRIEITSARVSTGEYALVKEVFEQFQEIELRNRIEILGFVDHTKSVDWIRKVGGTTINLLTKGSRRHCEKQLGKKLKEHLNDIENTILYAIDLNVNVNVYLEDWSGGYLESPDYVNEMLTALAEMPIKRFMLPDTLGIMSPEEVYAGISDALSLIPKRHVEFHAHNDYGLAVANSLSAVRAGVHGVHVTVNGLGERAGNCALEPFVTACHDKLKVKTGVNEKSISDASRLVTTFSGKRVAFNQPIVGHDVFTQTSGIHADGDKKNQLYVNPILPERFGRERVYALGKLSGKASITNNLEILGIKVTPEKIDLLLTRIKELGDQKKKVSPDDLPYIIEDMFGSIQSDKIKIIDVNIKTKLGKRPIAKIKVKYYNKKYSAESTGDGGYDAFMNALKIIAKKTKIKLPSLIDYQVHIPPGGETDSLVETTVNWKIAGERRSFTTRGVDCDQVIAAIKATEKMLNRILTAESDNRNNENAP